MNQAPKVHCPWVIEIRPARPPDAEAMATVQNAIHRAGLRATPVDTDGVRERHLDEVHSIACTVAVDDGRLVGFQSLKRAWINNPYGVPVGWGIIGTHIHPDVGRQGIGRRLFVVTRAAAEAAGLRNIDATIGANNAAALAFYASLGFVPYRTCRDDSVMPHRHDM